MQIHKKQIIIVVIIVIAGAALCVRALHDSGNSKRESQNRPCPAGTVAVHGVTADGVTEAYNCEPR